MKAVAALVALVLLVAVECSVIPYNGYYGYAQYFHGYYPGESVILYRIKTSTSYKMYSLWFAEK